MDKIDTSLLETRQERLNESAGELIETLEDMTEEEFDQRAAVILEQFDRNRQAIIQAKGAYRMEKVYTVDEVAQHLKLKPYTIREWLNKGKIQGTKIGKEWRILERDLIAFLEHEREKTIEQQQQKKTRKNKKPVSVPHGETTDSPGKTPS